MKKIINGFRYDTGKALLIGETRATCIWPDYNYWETGLYKTPRKGYYFLAGFGGPMSRYSKSLGQQGRIGGEKVDPMDIISAFRWAQTHLSREIVEKEFPDLIQEA